MSFPFGNAGASAQLGAYQQPDGESAPVANETVTGTSEVLWIWNRPSLIPGNQLR